MSVTCATSATSVNVWPNRSRLSTCRGCGALIDPGDVFADLGTAPLVNALLSKHQLDHAEIHYPLRALVCRECLLVQLPHQIDPQAIFDDAYPFRSGASSAWRDHCERFAGHAQQKLNLTAQSRVLEIGSNDGAGMLAFQGRGIPVMGIEPSRQAAEEALQDGIATRIEFWTRDLAQQLSDTGYRADLVLARNVLAHVPDLQGFLAGVRTVLEPGGTAVFEVPYLGDTIREGHWDQIYHEHHCYFSLTSLERALGRAGLGVREVEHLDVHGGSLRVYAAVACEQDESVGQLRRYEERNGLWDIQAYRGFASRPARDRRLALRTLMGLWGERIAGYGASAKAIVTLNYMGIDSNLIECVADTTPAKQDRYMPGSRIPIVSPAQLADYKPGVVINFCWNWKEESERNIRKICPEARIVYLLEEQTPAFEPVVL